MEQLCSFISLGVPLQIVLEFLYKILFVRCSMNQRENLLEVINWGKPEFVPNTFESYDIVLLGTGITDQPWQGGVDPFGNQLDCHSRRSNP